MSDSQITACKKACHSSIVQNFFAEKDSLVNYSSVVLSVTYIASSERGKMCANLEKQRGVFTSQSIKKMFVCLSLLSCLCFKNEEV